MTLVKTYRPSAAKSENDQYHTPFYRQREARSGHGKAARRLHILHALHGQKIHEQEVRLHPIRQIGMNAGVALFMVFMLFMVKKTEDRNDLRTGPSVTGFSLVAMSRSRFRPLFIWVRRFQPLKNLGISRRWQTPRRHRHFQTLNRHPSVCERSKILREEVIRAKTERRCRYAGVAIRQPSVCDAAPIEPRPDEQLVAFLEFLAATGSP